MAAIYYPKNNPKLKEIFTPEDAKRCKEDPVYFVDKFGWTFDPRPEAAPHHLQFKLYDFQKDFIRWLVERIRNGEDCFLEKSRDMGASWLVLSVIVWCWFYIPGFQGLVGSRKEEFVDNRMIDSLFGKIDYFIERLPFQPKGFSPAKHRTHMKLVNPENGNVIKGESANGEFSRAGRYTLALLDEIAFWESPQTAWTAAGESTRCRIAVTTPPKTPNFISALRKLISDGAIDIKMMTLLWRLHPKKTPEWYEEQCKRKLPEEVAQEIDINWEGSLTGRVYPEIAHVRLGQFPYRPDLPLYVSHDPGHDPDPYALIWWQADPETGRIRLLEAFEKRQVIIDWFAPFFGHPVDSQFSYTQEEFELIEQTKHWRGGPHFGDIAGRTSNSVSGKSPYKKWQDYGIYVQSNSKAIDHLTRKIALKKVLQHVDVNDTPRTRYWLECLKNYHYPELGENSQRVTANDKPVHDWSSHLSTASEYFAVNFQWEIMERKPSGFTFDKAGAMIDKMNQAQRYLN